MTMHHRRSFLTRSGLIASAAVAGSTVAQYSSLDARQPTSEPATSDSFRLRCAPVLASPTPTSMTVLWATSDAATGWVEYGETADLGQRAGQSSHGLEAFDERCFKVRLSNLRPGTRYHYRVHAVRIAFRNAYRIERHEEVRSEIRSFVTPDPASSTVRFTVWNDTHENVATLTALHTAHQAQPGDFLLWNGDQTNDIYSEEKMVGQFLSPAGLPFADTVPLHYVRGNHDTRGPLARQLYRFTDVPAGEYFYAFRQGPLAGIVLDTGEDKPDDHPVYGGLNDFAAFRARQAEWLKQATQNPEYRSAPFRILFCHIPLWWKDDRQTGHYCPDGRAKWHEALVAAGVQLVVSGHTHEPAWLPADANRPYGQLIGGGPKPEAATYIRAEGNARSLTLSQLRLDGSELHKVTLTA